MRNPGLLAGTGALAKANSAATVGVGVGNNSNLQATGNIFLKSRVNNEASANGISNSGGVIGTGIIKARTDITTVNNAVIGNDVVIDSSGDFQLLADSTNKGEVIADRAGGGVIDVSRADVDLTFNDQTATNIGNRASIKAKNNLTVQAQMQTTNGTNKATVSNGGLGVDTRANNNTNLTANTTTSVNGTLNASNVVVRADVQKINTKAETSAKGYGLGTGVYTTATNNTTSNVTVNILEQANIRGLDKVTIKAKQDNLDTQSYALGEGNSLGGNTDVTTNTNLNTNTTVNAKAGSVISTFELLVEANAPATPIFTADSSRNGAEIDTGTEKENPTLGLLRTIDFNSTVNIFAAKAPVLEIDVNGNVVQQKNVTFTQNATDIIVNDIQNSGSLSGSVKFSIASSSYDDGNTRKGELKGSPKIDFVATFDRVDIINRSTKNLTINNIDVLNNSSQLTSNITIAVPNQSTFTPITTSSTGATIIAIANTNTSATTQVNLSGDIKNKFGTTSVINNGGDILAPNSGKSIESTAVTLQSDNGAIGTTTRKITLKPTTLLATAKNDIFIDALTGGDLTIKQVTATTGDVTLNAVGSILDGNSTGVDISGKKVTLTSQTGSIGSDTDALEITATDANTGLSAIAQTNINLSNVGNGGFSIGQVNSTAGNITLTIPDSINGGQNLTLLNGAIISADAGNVTLNVGDNLTAAASSQIRGKTQVTVNADLGTVDAGQGANLDLKGQLSATSVQINTGDDVDAIALTNSSTNSTTTINAGGGDNKIFLGSKATSTGNSNGLLDNFLGQVVIQGGTGSDLLELDDSFDTKVNTGNLTNTQVTGLGMASGVQYAGIETLNVLLGSGKDTFNAQSTQDGTEAVINTGGGDDTINVGNSNQLNTINGLLTIRGDAGNDILNINDTGDTVANKGVLDSGRLTGFGMGSTDQTVVNGGRGISFGGLEKVNLNLGNAADELTVAGANTETIVNGGMALRKAETLAV